MNFVFGCLQTISDFAIDCKTSIHDFQLFFNAVGSDVTVEERDEELPLLPDVAIPQGRGNTIAYEPDAAETALLGYRRRDVAAAVAEIAAQFG